MILADTSAWIEYDSATGSSVHRRLRKLIETSGPLAVTAPVIMEVLAGARDDQREAALRRLLLGFELLRFDGASSFALASAQTINLHSITSRRKVDQPHPA